MRLLDTNVIIYAIGRPHRYKESCVKLLRDATNGAGNYSIDTELLQEILYVYALRGQRTLGLSTCNDLLSIFPNPLPIAREEIVNAHELLSLYSGLLPRDAIHAAVSRTNNLKGIVSADRIFDSIIDVERFDPLEL